MGEPASGSRGRVPGAGGRAREGVCAWPRRSARAGGGDGGGVRTLGTPPPGPRVPPPPSLASQFAPRQGSERSGAGSCSRRGASPGSLAPRTACSRAGDAGPPRARPSPGPGALGKGLSRPPPGWGALARSPSACSGSCSWGCSGRRCPAPERRAPQVSAPAGLPGSPRPPQPWEEKVGSGSQGDAGTRWESRPSLRTQLLRPGEPSPAPGPPLAPRRLTFLPFPPPPKGGSNFPRLLRIFPLAASHLSEPVTRVFRGGGRRRRFSPRRGALSPGRLPGLRALGVGSTGP